MEAGSIENQSKVNNWIYVPITFIVFVVIGTFILISKHQRQVKYQTTNGDNILANTSISQKQIINNIKKNNYTPSNETFSEIMKKSSEFEKVRRKPDFFKFLNLLFVGSMFYPDYLT